MNKSILFAGAFAISAALVPTAHAQILGGGGGLGGMVGGSLGGSIGGSLGGIGSVQRGVDSVTSATSGTLRGSASAHGSKSVDAKSGKASANGSTSASGAGAISQVVNTPQRSLGMTGSAQGGTAQSGSLDAQLVGTDSVGSTASLATNAAANAAGSASGGLNSAGGQLTSAVSGATSGGGSGAAGGSAGSGNSASDLSLFGNAEGSGDGGFTVTKGMPLFGPDGARLGRVKRVIVDAQGNVEQLLVKVDGHQALLPASNFTASGKLLVSAMGQADIVHLGQEQAAKPAPETETKK